jgi:hypothetical protein
VEWTNSDSYFTQNVDEEEEDQSEDDITIDTEEETSTGKFSKNKVLTGTCFMDD